MSQVVRLVTARRKADQAAASELAGVLQSIPEQLLLQLPGSVKLAISKSIHGLHRHARADTPGATWPGGFVMLSRDQTNAVWNAIRELKPEQRPVQVRDAFILMMLNIRQDTGEVMLSREEIAAQIGCSPNHVSRIMSTLERMGVITRDLIRVEGMRGRGVVTYKVNPHVAWNGSLDIRKEEAAATPKPGPLLQIMQGGRDDD